MGQDMQKEIDLYNERQSAEDKKICDTLRAEIDKGLAGSESKLWHGSPVWFLDGNPIVGYSKRKVGVTLLFWSGQTFEEKGLTDEGSFKAAEKRYTKASEIKKSDLKRWLTKAKTIQWDYKNIVKMRGKLARLKI
jgi:hypothetical protein